MRRVTASLVGSAVLAVLALAGCPGGGAPGVPGKGGKSGSVDPNTCGNYAASEAGAKLKAFLEATVELNDAVAEIEGEVKVSCAAIASELGVPAEGDTKTVCENVANAIRENLSAGLKGEAVLKIDYKPAVCEVKADVAAEAAAKCEAKASADVQVTCTGTCEGTCSGTCKGECAGSGKAGGGGAAASGECAGQCNGTCEGSCSGGCQGSADVQASAECEAKAEVTANVKAECTEPELTIAWDAKAVADAPKVEKVAAALKAGLPKLIAISAKLKGPVGLAFKTWAGSAKSLAKSSGKLYSSLGDQATCVAGQLSAAAGMVGGIEGSMSVSVEASASVSGSASGSAG
jgi:hypothetical protein